MRPLHAGFAGFECDREPAGLGCERLEHVHVCEVQLAYRCNLSPLRPLRSRSFKMMISKKARQAKRRLPLIWSRPQPPLTVWNESQYILPHFQAETKIN